MAKLPGEAAATSEGHLRKQECHCVKWQSCRARQQPLPGDIYTQNFHYVCRVRHQPLCHCMKWQSCRVRQQPLLGDLYAGVPLREVAKLPGEAAATAGGHCALLQECHCMKW